MIDVEVEDPAWSRRLPEAAELAHRAASAALRFLPRREDFGGGGPRSGGGGVGLASTLGAAAPPSLRATSPARAGEEGTVAILLADDGTVRELNARFRGKDAATNVLSFPAAANPEGHLGDIALAYGVCAQEAADQGKPFGHHLQHLVVHGVLHLLGHDHIGDDEAEAMEGLERVVLAGLGVPDPYAGQGRA